MEKTADKASHHDVTNVVSPLKSALELVTWLRKANVSADDNSLAKLETNIEDGLSAFETLRRKTKLPG